MPKMTERERLAKIEADQQNLAREAETVRRGLRSHYGKLATELPVERLSEREFRDVLSQAIGSAAAWRLPRSRGWQRLVSRRNRRRGRLASVRLFPRLAGMTLQRRCIHSGRGSDVGGRNARQKE
jgi:hypothetical protein